jgi:hypothetical protein
MRPMVGRAREIHDSTDAFERAVADQAGQLVTIGQTVLIGGGVGRRYLAPARATRLFEGFAKGMFYPGPRWYANNSGSLEIKVSAKVE